MKKLAALIIICFLSLTYTKVLLAQSFDDEKALAKELTTLYRSARAVISKNQAHINDPNVGDKGLGPDFVIAQAMTNYEKAAGHPLNMETNTQSKQAMLDAIASVMNNAPADYSINQEGKSFKGFLPAIFARLVATQFTENMDGQMKIKLTAPTDYVRNRKNKPDTWENTIIENNFRSDRFSHQEPVAKIAQYKGQEAFRYILPEYYKPSCLGCHGSPKGQMDITGGKKEGGKKGELGGAISLVIFK